LVHKHPQKAQNDFLEGRAGTSYASALQSGTVALFRSAFPGITAASWNDIVFASTSGPSTAVIMPVDFFNYVREICGGDWVNSVQWRELRTRGITKRRQLLAASKFEGKEIVGLPDLVKLQRTRAGKFAAGVRAYIEGRMQLTNPSTRSNAIQQL
jgi:hypothetical protein